MEVQKNYLDGIVAGAAKRDGLGNLIDKHYVQKEEGKGLSTNDYNDLSNLLVYDRLENVNLNILGSFTGQYQMEKIELGEEDFTYGKTGLDPNCFQGLSTEDEDGLFDNPDKYLFKFEKNEWKIEGKASQCSIITEEGETLNLDDADIKIDLVSEDEIRRMLLLYISKDDYYYEVILGYGDPLHGTSQNFWFAFCMTEPIQGITIDTTYEKNVVKTLKLKYIDSKLLEKIDSLPGRITQYDNKSEIFNNGNNEAKGYCSHAEGNKAQASGYCSHAEGNKAQASGYCSHAEGSGAQASGYCSHAEGFGAQASGYYSHAEGTGRAEGKYSHAEGSGAQASGYCSHAEGRGYTEGDYSHAEGKDTSAEGDYSHAEGVGTIAAAKSQHVQGKYNEEDTEGKYAHIVGNGKADQGKNIHTLDWEGNAWYYGIVDAKGIVLTSPNGTKFEITVDDEGNLQTNQMATQALSEGE